MIFVIGYPKTGTTSIVDAISKSCNTEKVLGLKEPKTLLWHNNDYTGLGYKSLLKSSEKSLNRYLNSVRSIESRNKIAIDGSSSYIFAIKDVFDVIETLDVTKNHKFIVITRPYDDRKMSLLAHCIREGLVSSEDELDLLQHQVDQGLCDHFFSCHPKELECIVDLEVLCDRYGYPLLKISYNHVNEAKCQLEEFLSLTDIGPIRKLNERRIPRNIWLTKFYFFFTKSRILKGFRSLFPNRFKKGILRLMQRIVFE